jgi:hypothetical protein
MTLRGFVIVLLLLVPSAALADPISLSGQWSSTAVPPSGDPTSLPLEFVPFWSGTSWDGPLMGVGYLIDAYGTQGLEYLHDGTGRYTAFRFDDEVLNVTKINGITAWTGGVFGRRADGAFTYDSGTGRVSNSWDSGQQYALFRLVGPDSTRYFLGIEDILLSEAQNDRDYNDYVVTFETASVPEPTTLLLMASGMAALALRKKRARRTARPATTV